ncbi:hypothetical protein V9T40_005173 [Parthenolecanium corni]|uniref:Uncharacterized protein n=1 Tax=Parthenolecanium corni TaxID=536013 RepID=A0AAN9TDP4_9HEMI
MMDFEGDLSDRRKNKLRRASAYSVGCGYVLRYYKDKLIDHLVCLYCYVNNKHDYISFNDKGKDGNIDSRHKSNPLCPEVNLLTGTVLFWNFLRNNVICLLATIFISSSIIFSVIVAVYFSIKNFDHWKKYLLGKNAVDVEQEVPPTPGSASAPPAPTSPIVSQALTATTIGDAQPVAISQAIKLSAANTLPLQCPLQLQELRSFPRQKLPIIEESGKNLATGLKNDIIKSVEIAAAGTVTSGHKVNKTVATSATRPIGARKMVAEGASKTSRGMGASKNGKNRISDPIYGQRDNRGTNKRPKVEKLRQKKLGGGSRCS